VLYWLKLAYTRRNAYIRAILSEGSPCGCGAPFGYLLPRQ